MGVLYFLFLVVLLLAFWKIPYQVCKKICEVISNYQEGKKARQTAKQDQRTLQIRVNDLYIEGNGNSEFILSQVEPVNQLAAQQIINQINNQGDCYHG